MPKEYINNRYHGQHGRSHEKCGVDPDHSWDTCEGQPVALDDSAVKVGWSKEAEHVEIALVHHRDGGEATDSDSNCWHSQFDRDGLNRLIRLLRKARDQAFGADA